MTTSDLTESQKLKLKGHRDRNAAKLGKQTRPIDLIYGDGFNDGVRACLEVVGKVQEQKIKRLQQKVSK